MNYLKLLLSVLSIHWFLNLTEAEVVPEKFNNVTMWATDRNSVLWDQLFQQIEILKAGNDILKLRMEMMELQIGKLGHYFTGIDQKLQNIDEKLQLTLKSQLEMPGEADERKHDKASAADIKTVDPFLDINNSSETVGNSHSEDKQSADLIATEKLFMAEVNGKDVFKVCSPKADNSLMCSNINLPASCFNSTPDACWNNKCYIQNQVYGWKPFWVSCNNTIDGGGWTVIQRRINGSVDFLRNWADYKQGFGELDGEFWIGLDKLHALTTALAPVELYVQLIDFEDVEKYAKYDSFAIGDEETKYVLKSLGSYSGTAGDSLGAHVNKKFTTKDQDNDNYWGNCVDIRHGAWWYDNCAYSNLNGRYFQAGTKPKKGDRNGISWYEFHHPDYSMKSAQMMIRPRKM